MKFICGNLSGPNDWLCRITSVLTKLASSKIELEKVDECYLELESATHIDFLSSMISRRNEHVHSVSTGLGVLRLPFSFA